MAKTAVGVWVKYRKQDANSSGLLSTKVIKRNYVVLRVRQREVSERGWFLACPTRKTCVTSPVHLMEGASKEGVKSNIKTVVESVIHTRVLNKYQLKTLRFPFIFPQYRTTGPTPNLIPDQNYLSP